MSRYSSTACAQYTGTLIRDTGKAWLLDLAGIGKKWIPCSCIVQYYATSVTENEYTLWIKCWILDKNNIPYGAVNCRNEEDIIEYAPDSDEEHEHIDEDEKQDMTDELDFSDEPESRNWDLGRYRE